MQPISHIDPQNAAVMRRVAADTQDGCTAQLVLLLAASFVTAPLVVAAVYLLDLPLYAVPVPAVFLFLV